MSKLLKAHLPCEDCGSSDALSEYEDHTYCFSCRAIHSNKDSNIILDESKTNYTLQYIDWRGIKRSTYERYGAKAKIAPDGSPQSVEFNYPNGRTKGRSTTSKKFYFTGTKNSDVGNLFGMDQFPAGSARAITITEGELDALSVYQMMGDYPAVSVQSASSAKGDCSKDYDYLNSFEKIYICFDNDEPGQKAAAEVARLFDFNKVYIVKFPNGLKDANDYLTQGKIKEFSKIWWASKRYLPEGIISSFSEIDDIIDKEGEKPAVPYPFQRLEYMTYGIRSGEYILFKAQEGIGKTELFRAIEYHLLKTTDANIGIIHLEEGKPRIIKGLVGYEVRQPIHLPDRQIPKDEIKSVYRKLSGRDERIHIYTHFGSDDPDAILNTIRFLAGACNCKYIFLDHITMVVTGLQSEDERKALDYISTRLAMMVEELDFTLFLISHVNDDGETRGSRNIAKVADLVVKLDRDKLSEIDEERNTTYLTVEKNRFAGRTGPAGKLLFDIDTYMLNEVLEMPGQAPSF